MINSEKTETLEYLEGEWNAITAPFLDGLKDKDPEYLKGFIAGLSHRFNLD